ncbi:prolyl oligopeptidase family serine peptidase [Pedobacter sp. HMF7647]|uniref:Prolyl oligopeptidase family serine peptidase n=1 Tax=Hufsiella arboris TaxID=2695275 RepID=A0A7K1YGE0_9SPHI|nr:alpha/beta hydrolase-fold protein [Hufsiella arboris]MXV53079.1 prolyl oligopeptidase family serine peptidase [Hufsiella arboris]
MTRFFFTLSISIALLTSCSTNKNQFGQTFINYTADTTISKQEVLKIRSLDNDLFDSSTFTGNEKIEIKYRLYKPKKEQLTSTEKYPLVVVYHGSGRPIGTDNKSQLGLLQKLFASPDIQKKYPAYVLAPQFPTRSSDYVMDTSRNVLSSIARPSLNSVLQLIDSLKSNLNIDTERIYVVGFSMGGSTVINSLSARPELFAAGISISGIPQFDKINELAAIPIWLIHGIDDTENPINSDEQFYKEMSSNVRFWKLKATTHDNIFTTQLLGETLPNWLFKQRKK